MEIKIDANEIKKELGRLWAANPVAVITAGALTLTAIAKLIDAVSAARGRRAYARQVNYRIRNRK